MTIERAYEIIQEVLKKQKGLASDRGTVLRVYDKLTHATKKIARDGDEILFRRAVLLEVKAGYGLDKISEMLLSDTQTKIVDLVTQSGKSLINISKGTNIGLPVLKTMLHNGAGSLENYIRLTTFLGSGLDLQGWDHVVENMRPMDKPLIEVNTLNETSYNRLLDGGYVVSEELGHIGGDVTYTEDHTWNSFKYTASGSVTRNEDDTYIIIIPVTLPVFLVSNIMTDAFMTPEKVEMSIGEFNFRAKDMVGSMYIAEGDLRGEFLLCINDKNLPDMLKDPKGERLEIEFTLNYQKHIHRVVVDLTDVNILPHTSFETLPLPEGFEE